MGFVRSAAIVLALAVCSVSEAATWHATVQWSAGTFPASKSINLVVHHHDPVTSQSYTQQVTFNVTSGADSKVLNLSPMSSSATSISITIYANLYNDDNLTGEMFAPSYVFCAFADHTYYGALPNNATIQFPAVTQHSATFYDRYAVLDKQTGWLNKDPGSGGGVGPDSVQMVFDFYSSKGDYQKVLPLTKAAGYQMVVASLGKWVLYAGDTWSVQLTLIPQSGYETAPNPDNVYYCDGDDSLFSGSQSYANASTDDIELDNTWTTIWFMGTQ